MTVPSSSSALFPGNAPSLSVARRICYWLVEERRRLLTVVAGISEEDVQTALEPDSWSVHAILSHRLFWEGREVEALGQHLLGRPVELLDFPMRRMDGANAAAVRAMHRYPTARILRELQETRALLASLVERLPDADLNTPDNPARVLLGVALEHDREHSQQIQRWLEQRAARTLLRTDGPSTATGKIPWE